LYIVKKEAVSYKRRLLFYVQAPKGDIHSLTAIESNYSHLGISCEMQEGSIVEEKNVPRGTLLWNGCAQYLV
jgi:hypothetical protein